MFWLRVSVYLFCLLMTLPVFAGFNPIQIDGPAAAHNTHRVYTLALAATTEVATAATPEAPAVAPAAQEELTEPMIEEDEEEMALTSFFTDIEKAAAESAELLEESPFEESDGIMVQSEQGEIVLEELKESSL